MNCTRCCPPALPPFLCFSTAALGSKGSGAPGAELTQRPLPLTAQPLRGWEARTGPGPWPPAQFVRCFVSILLQFCPWTGCLSALQWDWSNQRLGGGVGGGAGGEKEGRRGSVTRGDRLPGCVTQSLPLPLLRVLLLPHPCTFRVNIRSVRAALVRVLYTTVGETVWGCMGFEGTSKQAFQVMRLAFSAEPRGTHRTVVLSSVQLQGHQRMRISSSCLPAT